MSVGVFRVYGLLGCGLDQLPRCWLFYWSGVVQGSTGGSSWLKPTVSIRRLWSYDDFMTRHRVRLDCDWGTGWVVGFSFGCCVLSRGGDGF